MNTNIRPKRGLRSFYPTDKGPIDLYQLGHDGRIEYLQAQIAVEHLTKGLNTTEEWKKWAKERGTSADEPGLIISKRLGGSGIDAVNLFPKSPLLDSTSWTKDEEKAYKEAVDMKKWKKMKFFAKFEYPEDDSLRPSEIEYQYELPSGNKLHGKVSNNVVADTAPPPTEPEKVVVPASPAGAEAEAEEEGSEYEYEYEEEEEEEETPPQELPPSPPSRPPPSPPKTEETPVSEEKLPSKPEVVPQPLPKKRSPSPVPPPVKNDVVQPPIKTEPKPPPPVTPISVPEEPKTKPQPKLIAEVVPAAPKKDHGKNEITSNYRIFARSDLIEILPIVGSCKLLVDTVKAVYHKDAQRSVWKGAQTGLSLFADFHFIRAFARHGGTLVKPITEEKLLNFAAKAEPHIIIFVACKAGNQICSVVRRILSSKKNT